MHRLKFRRAWVEMLLQRTFNPVPCKLKTRRVDELRPHPSYAQLGLRVPLSKLNAVLEQGEDAFLARLTVTSGGILIDGYARWEVARLQRRLRVECIEYELSICAWH